jgi:hypothetical protein
MKSRLVVPRSKNDFYEGNVAEGAVECGGL